jgi:hypothetical protein
VVDWVGCGVWLGAWWRGGEWLGTLIAGRGGGVFVGLEWDTSQTLSAPSLIFLKSELQVQVTSLVQQQHQLVGASHPILENTRHACAEL